MIVWSPTCVASGAVQMILEDREILQNFQRTIFINEREPAHKEYQ